MMRTLAFLLLLAGAQDKRRIPPPGVPVPEADRAELEKGLKEFRAAIDAIPKGQAELLPDVEIYYKAIDWTLRYDEILNAKEIPVAKDLLKTGLDRAKQLKEGKPRWPEDSGQVVRGYVSKVDGSVQPYGLVVPRWDVGLGPGSHIPGKHPRRRLDLWLHGRSETLTELAFISQRQRSPGEFTPQGAIVLHLYGRFCNASKFAGEVDAFEAIESVKKRYPIDENRIVVRGFSMGGASCWHLAAHHAGLWAAAAPGAGFVETPIYANVYKDPVKPTWYQEKLWHLYNATDYAANLFNCPVIAYSGELDKQKAAADMMAEEMKKEGLELVHIIGPKTEHRYEPGAKAEVSRRIDELAAKGSDPFAEKIRFTTWTLKYNTMKWITVDALEKHWERARVEAERIDATLKATTQNVYALTFRLPLGYSKFTLDGQVIQTQRTLDRVHFVKADGRWTSIPSADDGTLRKRHDLQGPIDDAFMESFLVVRPTGKPMNETVGAWVAAELPRATEFWRRNFRGDARIKDDSAVTEADIAAHNLVLWGDPSSNAFTAKIIEKLPIKWDAKGVTVGTQTFSAAHVPILIYPNPLNPKRYVVLNSGFTFQDQAHLSNSRQVPMLPDWAVIDVSSKSAVAAGFFGERWELK